MADGHTIISRKDAQAAGLKRYFTGKKCIHGHIAQRQVTNGVCVECSSEIGSRFRKRHPDRILYWVMDYAKRHPEWRREQYRKYYRRHKSDLDARNREWARNNPEQARAHRKKWRENNKDRIRATSAEYRERTKDRRAKYNSEWAKNNPAKMAERKRRYRERHPEMDALWRERNKEKCRTYVLNRIARKRAAQGSHTAEDIGDILISQRAKCAICRCSLKSGYHVDHIYPLSKGGANQRSNLQLLCAPCNQKKHAKDPIDFMREIGRLL